MDRRNFERLIKEHLVVITKNEFDFLSNSYRNYGLVNYLDEELDTQIERLYYLYDKHKLLCKDYLHDHAIHLDRHKVAAILMCAVIDYAPIGYRDKNFVATPRDILISNYRIAFRFACSYGVLALHASFKFRLKEEKDPIIKDKINNALKMLAERGYPFFPQTREKLMGYMDNYILVLKNIFDRGISYDDIPYTLFADTFYWLDNYAKIQLGLDVPPEEYSPIGLQRPIKKEDN